MIEVNSNLKLEYDSFCFVTGSENLLIYDGGGKVLAYQNDSLNILDVSHYWKSSYNSFNFFRKRIFIHMVVTVILVHEII